VESKGKQKERKGFKERKDFYQGRREKRLEELCLI
jgi:hypothetical protein